MGAFVLSALSFDCLLGAIVITKDWNAAAKLLLDGKIGVIPTDTIYGISCIVSQKDLVEKIYKIKGRDSQKPFIILISSIDDLSKFSLELTIPERKIVGKHWPGPVSIVLDIDQDGYTYLHRSTKTLAFRAPKYKELVELLKKTGPLVSTSANISGNTSIKKISEVASVFKDQLDFYLDAGELDNPPSRVIKIVDGKEVIIRA